MERVLEGHLEVAAFLLEKGAEIDMVCTDGHRGTTPMQAAIAGKHEDLAYFLKQMLRAKKKKAMKGSCTQPPTRSWRKCACRNTSASASSHQAT